MAQSVKFGLDIPDVDVNKIESGAIGMTANSTSTGTNNQTKKGSGGGGGGSFGGSSATTTTEIAPTTVTTPTTTVDSDQLEAAGSTKEVALPDSTTPDRIDVSSALSSIEAQALDISKTIENNKERLDLENEQKGKKDELNDAFDALGNLGEFESELGEDVGLQEKKEAKTEIDNKILKKNRELDLAIREIEDTFGTRAQKNARKSEVINKTNRQLADLAIIQMARAGEYNDARSYVDEKVRLELQDRQADLNKLMFFYGENKERLTTLDQRAFQKKIQEEERAYQEAYAEKSTLEDFRLKLISAAIDRGMGNNALLSLQSAETMEELLSKAAVSRLVVPTKGGGSGKGGYEVAEEPMSINQIEQFRRSYGWTPPFGFTRSQLEEYMKANPGASAKELEAGAKQIMIEQANDGEETEPTEPTEKQSPKTIVGNLSREQLKKMHAIAKEKGYASGWTPMSWDVARYLKSEDKFQTALSYGYTYDEIIEKLTE